ncbi:uncharacterized protein LOC131853014 [Achroia grisella]|uniref:uncharacterized protein LOC131853014 n=1 Tax=Achroia grisella TaxID=688607 RepID=UPI0027D2846B|nr:uncharacterized protein LOC131853014 [Achroia grisella]
MNTGDDEPSSGLNGRLRPRKSTIPSTQSTKNIQKSDDKIAYEKPKRACTLSKATYKLDDLSAKADSSSILHLLCPYCDRKFASKQTLSKHTLRVHISISKQDSNIGCLYCSHTDADCNHILRHMVENHPNEYFACLYCHTRFASTIELAEHELNICEKQKIPYRSKLRQKVSDGTKKNQKSIKIDTKDFRNDAKTFTDVHGFNGIVISCELKPSQVNDDADIEDNITTNLILPPNKSLVNNAVIEKNAVIILDDIQWNKRIPSNFSFHNTDADQILSRLGVVHRSPRTAESTKKEWFRAIDESSQKFEKCFDTSFYSKVASNVQENLTKFLDGSFNFNPDPDSTIKTRKSKNSVVINTAEGFPILLAYAQYSRNTFDGYMPRAIAPKHKWKWDSLESDRNPINPDQIKRDSHTNNCIITLISSLDIWTQLRMRGKYEDKYNYSPIGKKTDKQNTIGKELKEILESRELPTSSLNVIGHTNKTVPNVEGLEFPTSLGLTPSVPDYDMPPAVLSGEWVRPRCYVCCACGFPSYDSRSLSSHIGTQHPNAQVQHYDVVGELHLNGNISKHLYVPPSQMYNRTRPLRGFRECTKCKKSVSLEDLHQHMLDCAGDTPTVRRKCRYRPFGVRRRRSRLPDNRISKKMRKDIRSRQTRQKSHMRPRPRNRTEVGDAETIRKMLADLPAKRHRVMVNTMNPILRPRKKIDKQRNKFLLKRRSSEDPKSRKLRSIKFSNNGPTGSTSNDNHKSVTSNDDDDKPLKPRLNRVTTKSTCQNESMRRRTGINTAKRKSQLEGQSATLNTTEMSILQCSGSVSFDQLSIDNTPQRIDVNNGPYNTREHSSRGGSNTREHNRSGSSSDNGNTNNSHAPTQNAPLKHSIASLTADSETHDKSVQFHHSFLVQQECNNVNHVPTGDRLFFENEAAVTKLDKPPLHFNQRNAIDPCGLQKGNKLGKPRKGLNDCIAMLKNKLEVPSSVPSSQISVQCGSDEPLHSNSVITKSKIVDPESQIEIIESKPAQVFSRHKLTFESAFDNVNQKTYDYQYLSTSQYTNSSGSMLVVNPPDNVINQKASKCKSKSRNVSSKCEITRRRSASHLKNEIPLKEFELVPQIVVTTQKQSEVLTNISGKVKQSFSSSQKINLEIETDIYKQRANVSQNSKLSPRQNSEMYAHPSIIKKPGPSLSPQTTAKTFSTQQNNVEIYGQARPTSQLQSEIYSCSKQKQGISPSIHSNSQQQIQNIHHNIQQSPNSDPALSQSKIKQKTSHCLDANSNQHSIININTEYTSNNTTSVEDFEEAELPQISAEIPPAHASNNIESLVSVPLDLSGKVTNVESSDNLLKPDSSHVSDYEVYETLDLSSKNIVLSETDMTAITDVVVDLRIKPSPRSAHTSSLDLATKNDLENIADLSIREREVDSVPTDLSMRGKFMYNAPYEIIPNAQRHDLQELSSIKTTISVQNELPHAEDATVVTPTDLSGKVVKDKISQKVEDINIKFTTNQSVSDRPVTNSSNLTVKVDKEKHRDYFVKSPVTAKESRRGCDQIINKPVTRTFDKTTPQNQLYEPTLKVSQFKIKTTATTTSTCTEPIDVLNTFQPLQRNTDPLTNTSIVSVAETKSQDSTFTDTSLSVLIPQEHLSYEMRNTSFISSSTRSTIIPIYTLSNPISTTPISKHESTTPVYTLANACISVTKIDRPGLIPLTSSLLSIPGTTIASTTSVYTLAGTTIGAPMNYGAPPNLSTQISPSTTSNFTLPSFLTDTATSDMNSYKTNHNISPDTTVTTERDLNMVNKIGISAVDQDPETARKIALLPKELVEILGTMPVGHRNQLLNVLPQYVSNIVTTSISLSESTHITTNTSTAILKPPGFPSVTSTPIVAEIASFGHDKYNVAPLNVISPLTSLHQSMGTYQAKSQTTGTLDFQKKDSLECDMIPLASSTFSRTSAFDNVGTTLLPITKKMDEDTKLELTIENKGKVQVGHISESCPNLLLNETIIDLTDDDSIIPTTNVKLADEFPRNIVVTSHETQTFVSVTNTNKQKSTNEKTSSLRAVRIKAPSERHKSITDISLHKPLLEPQIKCNINDQEKQICKVLDTDKTMISQQVEVSSTQYSNNPCELVAPTLPDKSTLTYEDMKNNSASLPNTIRKEEILQARNEHLRNELVVETSSISPPDSMTNEFVARQSSDSDTCKDIEINFASVNENINKTSSQNINASKVSEEIVTAINSDLNNKTLLQEYQTMQEDVTTTEKSLLEDNSRVEVHEEDESDDDISLAVIVKQKQEEHIYNPTCKDDTFKLIAEKSDRLESKKKKKDRKLKKVKDVTTEQCTDMITLELSDNSATNISVDKQDEICTKHLDGNVAETEIEATMIGDKHSKKKTRKNRLNINSSEVLEQQTEEKNENKELDNINITHDNKFDKIECTKFEDKISMSKDISNSQNNSHVSTSMKFADDDVNMKNDDAYLNNMHMDNLDELKANKCINLNPVTNIDTRTIVCETVTEEQKKKKSTLSSLRSNEECSIFVSIHEEKEIPSLSRKKEDCETKNENTKLKSDELILVIKCDDFDTNDTISDVCVDSEKEDSMSTPLRRSRRGKSLFVDNELACVDNMNIQPNVPLEQRTPLTKKQLIFSKLLLDEENTKGPAHSTPEKNIDANKLNITLSSNVLCTTNEIGPISIIEKTRSKRRLSPSEKRRNKKRKSLEDCHLDVSDCTDTDNSQSLYESTTNMGISLSNTAESKSHDKLNATLNKGNLSNKRLIDVNEVITPISNDDSDVNSNKTDIAESNSDKLVYSIEKRKANINQDLNQGPKPKKSKTNFKDVDKEENYVTDKINIKYKLHASGSSDVRTACYNLPVPSKRTRSKSVVVKSSEALTYDPYDIDLDDMIKNPNPLHAGRDDNILRKGSTSKTKERSSNSNKKYLETKEIVIKKSIGKTSHQKSQDTFNSIEQHESTVPSEKANISDSDDSSKSDVPLQKYVEEKERRISELDSNDLSSSTVKDINDDNDIDDNEQSNDKTYDDNKKSRRTLGICNNVESISVQNEADEQLRSEQFMESFGFFSERKPRKSNLLASKKISETFHIIANETDDVLFGYKERATKKSLQNENKKSAEGETNPKAPQQSLPKVNKASKRGRKKKTVIKTVPRFCNVCKKEFRRSDNYLRHQMTMLHVSKLCEVEMKIKTNPVHEEPNYLIAYKQYVDRLKILTDKFSKRKKSKTKKFKLPPVEEIMSELNIIIRDQQLSERELSRDEALFIDCCELLKESHKTDHNNKDRTSQTSVARLDLIEKPLSDEKFDSKSDGDVDSITAKNILESEEVRNLENDLISGLKEAANAKIDYSNAMSGQNLNPIQHQTENCSSTSNLDESRFETNQLSVTDKTLAPKAKKIPEYKEKMYPDIIEDIDMYEDKFDKIKRKCRSQAAAAKQTQIEAKPSISRKGRKKSNKKKNKKSSKKNSQSTQVLTKGALKGFDGIKVSIPRSDIDMSTIVPPIEISKKKKKKTTSKKKRDKKDSESSSKSESEHRSNEVNSEPQKKVDVYEFMDNEDAELFEFRPSTLMERFKSINKDQPSTSKCNPVEDAIENSSESCSYGDDFVYMSDDYVNSDETENSLVSSETGNNKGINDKKNSTSLKRKDIVEKNAVMGKIFKHNAVRTEKKNKNKEPITKPKANLDQLFDSLLEDEPNPSTSKRDSTSPPQKNDKESSKDQSKDLDQSKDDSQPTTPHNDDVSTIKDNFVSPKKIRTTSSHKKDSKKISKKHSSSSKEFRHSSKKKRNSLEEDKFGPSTSKQYETNLPVEYYGPSTSKMHDTTLPKDYKTPSPKIYDTTSLNKYGNTSPLHGDSSQTSHEDLFDKYDSKNKSPVRAESDGVSMSFEFSTDSLDLTLDDAGVARQRARRKCTVGKQNVLAESWSSESEPDGRPPRPCSAESVLGGARKRKGKKKEGQQSSGRKGSNKFLFKKQDVESRVTSSNRNTSSSVAIGSGTGKFLVEDSLVRGNGASTSGGGGSVSTGVQVSLGPPVNPGPSGLRGRPRHTTYCWSSEGDDEQEHLQQHGWIVGDSHKKLVTMLAHAKGRKRNNDDKSHLVE